MTKEKPFIPLGDIEGESKDDDHKPEIDVLAVMDELDPQAPDELEPEATEMDALRHPPQFESVGDTAIPGGDLLTSKAGLEDFGAGAVAGDGPSEPEAVANVKSNVEKTDHDIKQAIIDKIRAREAPPETDDTGLHPFDPVEFVDESLAEATMAEPEPGFAEASVVEDFEESQEAEEALPEL